MKHLHWLFGAALAATLGLTGCDDSDSSGGGGGGSTLSGTAAVGAAIGNATVTFYGSGADDVPVEVTTSATGKFSAKVGSLTPPILIVVDNGSDDLASISFSQGGTVNITPLTNMAVALMYGVADPTLLSGSWDADAGNADSADLLDALKVINANLAAVYNTYDGGSIDETTYNFFTTPFSANGSGFDGLLDTITCGITDGDPDVFTCNNGSDIVFNLAIDTSAFFAYGDLGFAIPVGSTWTYAISGKFNGANIPTQNIGEVPYTSVPFTSAAFEDIGVAFAGTGYGSASITVDSFSITSQGTGAVGSKVIGKMSGKMSVEGVFTNAPFTYTFTWTLQALPET